MKVDRPDLERLKSREFKQAEEEMRRAFHKFIINYSGASERLALALWKFVTSSNKEEVNDLIRAYKIFIERNPTVSRNAIKDLYHQVEYDIITNKKIKR